jgi:hypothetical protein
VKAMAKDYLQQILTGLKKSDDFQSSVFQPKTEKTHPVQVRESTYNTLKKLSFEQGIKIVDLVDIMLQYALDSHEFDK